jgi:hypothetical protein
LLPNRLIDDRLGVLIKGLPAAMVTDVRGNRDTTENVTFVCPPLERDLSIAPDQAAKLAKSTA